MTKILKLFTILLKATEGIIKMLSSPLLSFKKFLEDESIEIISTNFTSNKWSIHKCAHYFVVTDTNKELVFFQEYLEKDGILFLKSRQKFSDTRGVFGMFVVELLSKQSLKYKYIQDDDIHTQDNISSIESLLVSNKLDIKVFNTFTKELSNVELRSKKILWDSDKQIRCYKNHNTVVSESIKSRHLEMFGEQNQDAITYGCYEESK